MERKMTDYRNEAMNFWAQARADLATAVTLMDAGTYCVNVARTVIGAEPHSRPFGGGARHSRGLRGPIQIQEIGRAHV